MLRVCLALRSTPPRTICSRKVRLHSNSISPLTPSNPTNSWRSAILLRHPVSVIDLQAFVAPCLEAVVLSACERQGTAVDATDETLSLQRAFAAGAHTVAASLWKIADDPNRELMLAFYQYLRDGRSRAEALALAQNEVRARYPQPSTGLPSW
jgi:CHAT domain-containing protein